jgi:probable HAF family extracellular repeat protein
MRSLTLVGALVLLLASTATASPAPPHYSITDLGTLGGAQSVGNGINDAGQVVGNSTLANGSQHAFLWSAGTMQDLGAPAGGQSNAYRVNNFGAAVGQANGAVVWDHGVATLLGSAGTGWDINDAGFVAGDEGGTAEIWTPLGRVDLLLELPYPNLPPWGPGGSATSINNSGWWAGLNEFGAWWPSPTPEHWPSGYPSKYIDGVAFYAEYSLYSLGTPARSTPTAMNEKGENVGFSHNAPGNLAVLWTGSQASPAQSLGTLGGAESRAWDINDASQIVGEAEIGTGPWHAFIYTASEGMVDLNSRIDSSLGWVLQTAHGINAASQIAGTGTINGQTHAFLLTPVPSSGTGAWLKPDAAVEVFDTAPEGGGTSVRTMTVTNTGDAALTISAVSVAGTNPGDFAVSGGTGVTIPPGGSTPLTVTFQPTAAGFRAGYLTIAGNAYYSLATVTLLGKGIGTKPTIQVDTTSFDFGSVPLTTNASKTVMITNSGDADLTISGVSFTGANPGDFTLTGSTAPTLTPGQSTTLTVTFSPAAIGTRTATLGITSNAINGPTSISFRGSAVAATRWVQIASSLDFGSVGLSTTSSGQTLTIKNLGNVSLTISGVTLTGANAADFSVSGGTGVTLAPNATTPLTVTLSPTAIGTRSSSLVITSNADNSPTSVALTGTGVEAPPAAPSGLSALLAGNKVNLAWTDNSNNETGFEIYRGVGGGTATLLTTVGPNTASYSDSSVTGSSTYTYQVRAINTTWQSAFTNSASVTTATPPSAPTVFAVTGHSYNKVSLGWVDTSNNETAFEIYRKMGSSPFVLIGPTPPNTRAYVDTTVSPTTTYSYEIRAANDFWASAFAGPVTVTTTVAPPAAPSGLSVIGFSYNKVSLAWIDNSTNETAFEVYRRTGSGAYALVSVLAPDTTFFVDTTVSPTTTYTYEVRAANDLWASAYTNAATVTTVQAPPAAPSGLTASLSGTKINLKWTDNSTNETAFEVYRKVGTGSYSLLAVLGPNTTSYTDTGMAGSTTYSYEVRAANNLWASAYSNTASVTTAFPPAAPTGLTATAVSSTQINLRWVDNSNNETAFEVYRLTGTGSYVLAAVLAPGTTAYADRGMTGNTTYSFQVRAANDFWASAYTNVASAHTP